MPSEILSAIYGVLSAIAYGSGDFTGGLTSKKSSVYAVIIISQFVGMILYLLLAILAHETMPPIGDLILVALGGLIGVTGLLCLYTSLSRGQMGIAAPVSGVMTAAIPVIAGMLVQGLPKLTILIGFAIGLVAVWLIARSPDSTRIDARALLLPVAAGTFFGIGFLLFFSATQHALFFPLMTGRIASVSTMILLVLFARKPFHVTSTRVVPLIGFAGVLDAAGNGFYVLAAQVGRIDIASVLTSIYPAVTVILAWLVLRERLSRVQGIGVLLALIAIALIVA